MSRRLALLLLAAPVAAQAEPRLMCLGSEPNFMLLVEGEAASFDYLGDGSFAFTPPPRPGLGYSVHRLAAARTAFDVHLAETPCPALDTTLPVSVEVAVPTAAGLRPLRGCCLWQGE